MQDIKSKYGFPKMEAIAEKEGGESIISKKRKPDWQKWKDLVRKAISNSGDLGGGNPKIRRLVSNAVIQIAFKSQCPIWIQKKKNWASGNPTIHTKGERPKGQKGKEGKRRRQGGKVCLSGNGRMRPID